MGYGLLKPEDVEVGRLYMVPIAVDANPPALFVTKVMLKFDDGFIVKSLDGSIQRGEFYNRPNGIILKEFKGKLDFRMGRSLLEQMALANTHK